MKKKMGNNISLKILSLVILAVRMASGCKY